MGKTAAVIAVAAFAALAGGYWPALWNVCVLDRDALLAGQVWRLWTGHLMHLDLPHATVNLAALGIISGCAARWHLLVPLMLVSLLLMPLLGLALMLVRPELHWYVGLSGLLHGGMVWLLPVRGGRWVWPVIALVVAKLVWQGIAGVEPWVVQEAHWLGAALGAAMVWPARRLLAAKQLDAAAMR